ncbi:MAG: CRISPR-associated endonuclease Cas3'', partial [Myxococcales bacterium]|nr:CRISPR-associated endonuclease Cas3'' [Myxococcales bacterium]
MDGSIRGFWGKLERDGDLPVRWHSLEDHLADVSACFEALLERTILGPRLARLLGQERLSDSLVARLCVFAALHDIGKLNHGFQRRSDPEARRVAGHVSTALIALGSYAPLAAEIAGAGLLAWGEPPAWEGLLRATICHHGYPVIEANEPFDRSLWEDSELRSPLAGLRSILGRVREWYPLAFAEGPPLPREPEFHHAFSGLVTLADWLGSDQRLFPFSAEPGDRIAFARERAQRALGAMGLLPAGARASLGALPIGFERISAWAPRPMQRCIAELPLHPAGSLTILESDTGSGKTEAALAHYLRLFQDHLVDGLYFALPTRTAATQIFRRTHESVMRAFPDPEQRPPVVLAVPGYLRFDEVQGKLLAPFEVLWPDEGRDRHRSWAAEHPKRFLAAAVAIGTIDQALLSTVKTKHAQMRASALMRQLLVVDEVHASDAYMNELLGHVLRHHLRAGGHALLMSATLGAEARARLMRAAGGSGQCLGLDAALQLPYPLVEDAPLGAPARRLVVEPDRLGQQIQVALRGIAADPDAIAAAAIDAAERGARVLILRNTVCDCVATQQALDAELERRGRPELAFRV